jgi:Nuclease-related domain
MLPDQLFCNTGIFTYVWLLRDAGNHCGGVDASSPPTDRLDYYFDGAIPWFTPAEGFNIDHVVVGRNGVFAVETKGRSKPVKGRRAVKWSPTFRSLILEMTLFLVTIRT